jgi:hypothetical protein
MHTITSKTGRIWIFVLVLALSACGGGGAAPANQTGTPSSITGNYSGTFASSGVGGTWDLTVDVSGDALALATSSGKDVALLLAGKVDANGVLALATPDKTAFIVNGTIGSVGDVAGTFSYKTTTIGTIAGSKLVTGSGVAALTGNAVVTSSDFGTETLMPSREIVMGTVGPYKSYYFTNQPLGWPVPFAANIDILGIWLYASVDTGELVQVNFQYFNSGTIQAAVPPEYDYQMLCGGIPDPCSTISFNAVAGTLVFNATSIPALPGTGTFGNNVSSTSATVTSLFKW